MAERPLWVIGGCGVPAHTDISYVVPPTPVTFLTLLWRLGLRAAPWALGWQSICPLTFMASLSGKRRIRNDSTNKSNTKGCENMHISWNSNTILYVSHNPPTHPKKKKQDSNVDD